MSFETEEFIIIGVNDDNNDNSEPATFEETINNNPQNKDKILHTRYEANEEIHQLIKKLSELQQLYKLKQFQDIQQKMNVFNKK